MLCFAYAYDSADMSASGLHPAAAAVDLAKVRRRVLKEKHWTEERVDAAVAEYRRFATLAAAGVPMPPCLDVDEIWHAHILHTIDYSTFSAALLGPGSFLHHVPADPEDTPAEQREAMKNGYSAGLTAYRERFGAEPHAMWGGELPAEADAECAPCLYKAEDGAAPAEPSGRALCINAAGKDAGMARCVNWTTAPAALCIYNKAAGSDAMATSRGGALCINAPAQALCFNASSREARGAALCINAPAQALCFHTVSQKPANSKQAFCWQAPQVSV
ncbi:hypothetical protein DFJ74DRAFT_772071 [Hyaloraphidium curvatum]|nr:hypothetical protein DFJ74DRAFT_772071 [Hyaloraphidium curvatum]